MAPNLKERVQENVEDTHRDVEGQTAQAHFLTRRGRSLQPKVGVYKVVMPVGSVGQDRAASRLFPISFSTVLIVTHFSKKVEETFKVAKVTSKTK